MKISIITPCYNAAPYIANTIQSVQNQTILDWEMIIVDDGSTDNSVEIIQKIIAQDSRIKLIQKENGGSASARNLALSIAQGEYIQFLDSDDTIDYKKLERQITLMEKEDLDVSYSDWCFVLPDGTMEKVHGLNFNLVRILLLWGTLFGAFIVFGLQQIVLVEIPFFAQNPDISVLFTGALMIIICMFFPGGFAEIMLRLKIVITSGLKKWRVRKYGIEA
jgi:glycosyltransferase involved in cell wall biosynthesis